MYLHSLLEFYIIFLNIDSSRNYSWQVLLVTLLTQPNTVWNKGFKSTLRKNEKFMFSNKTSILLSKMPWFWLLSYIVETSDYCFLLLSSPPKVLGDWHLEPMNKNKKSVTWLWGFFLNTTSSHTFFLKFLHWFQGQPQQQEEQS